MHLLEFVNKNPGVVVYLQPRRHRTPKLVAEYCKWLPSSSSSSSSFFIIIIFKKFFVPPVVKMPGLKTKLNVKNYWDDQRSDVSLVQKLSRTRMALKRCSRIDSRWNKNTPSRASLEMGEILRPKSSTKQMADSLIGPRVSSATGWNIKEAGISSYLETFLAAANSAAAPAVVADWWIYELLLLLLFLFNILYPW